MSRIKNKLHRRNMAYASMDNDYPLGVITNSNENQIKNAYGKGDYYESSFNGKSELVENGLSEYLFYGDSKQVESENLLNTKNTSGIIGGVTYSVSNGTVTLNGTAQGSGSFVVSETPFTTSNAYLSRNISGTASGQYSFWFYVDNVFYKAVQYDSKLDDKAYNKLSFGWNPGAIFNNVKFALMISNNTTQAKPYTPYFNPYIKNKGENNLANYSSGTTSVGNVTRQILDDKSIVVSGTSTLNNAWFINCNLTKLESAYYTIKFIGSKKPSSCYIWDNGKAVLVNDGSKLFVNAFSNDSLQFNTVIDRTYDYNFKIVLLKNSDIVPNIYIPTDNNYYITDLGTPINLGSNPLRLGETRNTNGARTIGRDKIKLSDLTIWDYNSDAHRFRASYNTQQVIDLKLKQNDNNTKPNYIISNKMNVQTANVSWANRDSQISITQDVGGSILLYDYTINSLTEFNNKYGNVELEFDIATTTNQQLEKYDFESGLVKNIFDIKKYIQLQYSYLVDNVLYINANLERNPYGIYVSDKLDVKIGDTIYVSFDAIAIGGTTRLNTDFYPDTIVGVDKNFEITTTKQNFSFSSVLSGTTTEAEGITFRLWRLAQNPNYEVQISNIMISKTPITQYEPFIGADETKLKDFKWLGNKNEIVKNIIAGNKDTLTRNGITFNALSTTRYSIKGTNTQPSYSIYGSEAENEGKMFKAGTYTISAFGLINGIDIQIDTMFLRYNSPRMTFTLNKDFYIRINVNGLTNVDKIIEIVLLKGNNILDYYIPSDDNIYTQVVNGTDKFLLKTKDYIRDIDVVESNKVVRKKARVDLSSLNWYLYNSSRKIYRATLPNFEYKGSASEIPNFKSTKYEVVSTNASWVNGNISVDASTQSGAFKNCVFVCDTSDTPSGILEYELADAIEEPIIPLRLKQDNTTYLTDGYFTSYSNYLNRHLSKGYVENLTHYGKNGKKEIGSFYKINGKSDLIIVEPNQLIPTDLTTLNTSTSSVPSSNMTGSYITKWIGLEGKVGHKVFAKITTTNTSLRLCWYKSGSEGYDFVNGTLLNGSSTPSSQMTGIYTITQDMVWTDGYMQLYYWIYSGMSTGSHTLTVQLVDLTDLYGAGNEPSDIVRLFSDYPILNTNTIRNKTNNVLDIDNVGYKNLLDIGDRADYTLNGITRRIVNNTIIINGTATAQTDIGITISTPINVTNKMLFKRFINQEITGWHLWFNWQAELNSQNTYKTLPLREYTQLNLRIDNGYTFNNFEIKLLVTSGETVHNIYIPADNHYYYPIGDTLIDLGENPLRQGEYRTTDGIDYRSRYAFTISNESQINSHTERENGCEIGIRLSGANYKWLNADYWKIISCSCNYKFARGSRGGYISNISTYTENWLCSDWNATYNICAIYFFFYGKTYSQVLSDLSNNPLEFEYDLAQPTTTLSDSIILEKGLESKNLCTSKFEIGGLNKSNGSTVSQTDRIRTIDFIKVKPNTTYIISVVPNGCGVIFYNSSNNYISYSNDANPFTTPSNCAYIKFMLYHNTDINTNIMLNEGTSALPYQPHIIDYLFDKYELQAAGQGGNLLNIQDVEKTTINGITYSCKNGIITLNGTPTVNFNLRIPISATTLNGTYTINYFNNDFGGSFGLFDGSKFALDTAITKNATKTESLSNYNATHWNTWLDTRYSFNNVIIKPMLVKGDVVPTNFAPYGKYAIENKVVGENLIGGVYVAQTTPNVYDCSKLKENNYKLTCFIKYTGGAQPQVRFFDKNKNYLDYYTLSDASRRVLDVSSLSIKDDIKYVGIMISTTTTNYQEAFIGYGNIQRTNPYLPYYESKTTWLLDEPLYADSKADENGQEYGWKEINAWEYIWKYEISGERHIFRMYFSTNNLPIIDYTIATEKPDILINLDYNVVSNSSSWVDKDISIGQPNNITNINMAIVDNRFDGTTFIDYLQANNVKIRYKLANPKIVKQTNYLPKIQSGNSNIQIESGELKPTTILEYYSKDYKPQGTTQPIQPVLDAFDKQGNLDWSNRKINYEEE